MRIAPWALAVCLVSSPLLGRAADKNVLAPLQSPAGPGSMAPNLTTTEQGTLLTWLEPDDSGGHVLFVSQLDEDRWSDPRPVNAGHSFFANWADIPGVAALPNGDLVAHWLQKTGDDTYAYGVSLARSNDQGRSWSPLGLLHDDRSLTEHGFVSYAATDDGLWAFWLDGRAMASDGPMGLRTARLAPTGPGPSELLDERVCECCQTDAATAAAGPVVVYRNRSDDEIRDPWIVRWANGRWSQPRPVSEDGWEIPGCPVNGPAVAARGETVVVVWFTGAGGSASVRATLSNDGGASFATPIVLDDDRPIGRVDVVLTNDDAVTTWLDRSDAGAAVRMASLAIDGAGLRERSRSTLIATSAARSSGFPRLAVLPSARRAARGDERAVALDRDRLVVAWVESDDGTRVRTALVDLD